MLSFSLFYTKVHPIQASRSTQGIELLNDVCDMNVREDTVGSGNEEKQER